MSDFHLLRPEWILLILPLAILFFFKQIKPLKAGNWQSVISPKLQQYVLSNTQQKTSQRFTQVALWLSALLAILALSGPSWQKQSSEVYRSQQGLIIGFDLSLSMTSQDVAPSRVQRAKYKIMDVLKAQRGQNIGLIAYAGDAHVVSPLTQDTNTVKSLLTPLDPYIMPSQGSNLVSLAQETANLFEQAGSSPRTLLLVTDGVETRDIQPAAQILRSAGIRLAILAVGTKQGAPMVQPDGRFFKDSTGQVIMPPLEWDNLQQLASATGAQIKRLSNNDRDITSLLSSFSQREDFKKDEDENMEFDQWLDSGFWLVLPLLVLCLGAFRKGIILSIAVIVLVQPNDSVAQINLPDVLLNGDQQGEKYFEQNPAKAAEAFNDPKWKASSLYKAGDYQGALDIWQQFDDAQSLYNQGNALAQLQQIDQAIAAYDAALKKQSDFDDAKANKALLEQLKQNQQNQQNNPQQNQDGSDSQDSSEQNQDSGESSDQNSEQQNQSQNSDSQDGQSQDSQSSDSNESQQNAQQSDGDTQSENPLEQAQTEEEKQRQEEMDALKEQMAQHTQDEKNSENEGEQTGLPSQPKSQADLEQEQAMQQWIQRIPDDPGGLLRNKFLYQYQQRQGNTEQNGERKPW
ncbi:VWA domain-containing protein [Bermanella sp. WJH001]|uniref:VWA domain-containing protein n=1 Tax=Bermanella sp. WJH001 TaxID=3048005 RepID=UPI0024BDAC14|nr:VWA domain-containing protein [Bermanella sp. WJH001]MDJ1536670.1 VWA domain-containing protein [Bermanella sp. WJH001]